VLPGRTKRDDLHRDGCLADARSKRRDCVARVAELIDEAVGLRVAAAPHAALRDGVHFFARAFASGGDDVHEAVVEVFDLALEGRPLVVAKRMKRVEKRRASTARERLGDDADLLHERLDDDARGDDADGSRDRRRLRDDVVSGCGGVVSTARRDVAEVRDDGLFLGELHELVVHAVGREGSAAGRIDVKEHATHATARSQRAHRGDESIVERERARPARDGSVKRQHREHGSVAQTRQHARAPRREKARGRNEPRGTRWTEVLGQLVFVGHGIDETDLSGFFGRVGRAIDERAGLRFVHVATGGDRRDELAVERVENGAELLALRIAHVVERERFTCALVGADREPLSRHADLVERSLGVARARQEADGRERGVRGGDDAARRARNVELFGVSAAREVNDDLAPRGLAQPKERSSQ